MSTVIDLRKKSGTIKTVPSFNSVTEAKGFNFIKEVVIDDAFNACYLTNGSTLPEGHYHFNTGIMMIPKGAQWVRDFNTWEPESTQSLEALITYIILDMSANQPTPKAFHLCEQWNMAPKSRTDEGCAKLPSPLGGEGLIEDPAFLLFCLSNQELYFSKNTGDKQLSDWYLIPMLESDFNVTYYVIDKKSDQAKNTLDTIKKKLAIYPDQGRYIGIHEKYQLNDDLMIRVTRKTSLY